MGNKPEKKFRMGGVVASVFKNKGKTKDNEPTEYRTVTIVRNYKDGDEWKSTNSFKVTDLPKVALVAQEAFKFLALKEIKINDKDEEIEEEDIVI